MTTQFTCCLVYIAPVEMRVTCPPHGPFLAAVLKKATIDNLRLHGFGTTQITLQVVNSEHDVAFVNFYFRKFFPFGDIVTRNEAGAA